MKILHYSHRMLFIITIMLCGVSPSAYAQSTGSTDVSAELSYSPIVISEVLPGTRESASQEFIELYNQSTQSINLRDDEWQVQIARSTAADWSRAKTITLAGTFYPGTYMLLSSSYIATGQTKPYLDSYASAHFASGMTGAAGHVRLVNKTSLATAQPAISAIEWSTQSDTHVVSSPSLTPFSSLLLSDALSAGSSIKRKLHATSHLFIQTLRSANSELNDLLISSCPSPTANNTALQQVVSEQGPIATSIDSNNQSCTEQEDETSPDILLPDEQQVEEEAQNDGLATPQITELLPNPASPATDSEDEFIELYNPNQATFDLSNYILEVAGTSVKQYTIPEDTTIAAQGYIVFRSSQTRLSLPNTSAQVVLRNAQGQNLSRTDLYSDAKEGQAWAIIDTIWQWTLEPTANYANIRKLPLVAATPKANVKAATATTKAKTAAKATTAKSKAAAKPAKAKAKAAKADVAKAQPVAAVTTMSPVHPVVLAVVGAFALLYGAYEYRGDVANKIHQFRANRANRRANR